MWSDRIALILIVAILSLYILLIISGIAHHSLLTTTIASIGLLVSSILSVWGKIWEWWDTANK